MRDFEVIKEMNNKRGGLNIDKERKIVDAII